MPNRSLLIRLTLAICATTLCGWAAPCLAEDESKAKPPVSSPSGTSGGRNFYEVLEDLMGDFEYDLKNGQVKGLQDLSIRNIATSENIPPSFKNHLELNLTERVLKNTRTKMLQCLACKSKRTTVNGDQVVISSNESNPIEMARIAKLAGIMHFMDVAFTYQPTGMMMSLTVSEPESGSIIWSRSYNSETSRASAFRRGVDYTQLEDMRKANEYIPTLQHRISVFYLFEPDLPGTTGCLGVGYRLVERYDNRKKEVGFEIDYLKDSSSLVGSSNTVTVTGTTKKTMYGGFNATLLFIHAWNLIGIEENYNMIRGSIFAGIGGTYASGFLGGLIRVGYEWRLARYWGIQGSVGFRPSSTAFVGGTASGSVSGAEFGLGVSVLF